MVQIRRVKQLDLSLTPTPWAFAEERRAEIETHFAKVREAKPAVWNGRVLFCRNPRAEGDVYRADYFETDFASFLAWRDWGFPDKSVFNSFGAGALRSADGAFVLGRMNAHTANAGRIYFPAGTPDPNDVVDRHVDLAASVVREVEEEIGLTTLRLSRIRGLDHRRDGAGGRLLPPAGVAAGRAGAARADRGVPPLRDLA